MLGCLAKNGARSCQKDMALVRESHLDIEEQLTCGSARQEKLSSTAIDDCFGFLYSVMIPLKQ